MIATVMEVIVGQVGDIQSHMSAIRKSVNHEAEQIQGLTRELQQLSIFGAQLAESVARESA